MSSTDTGNKSNMFWIIVICVCILVLIGAGVGVYFLTSSDQPVTPEQEQEEQQEEQEEEEEVVYTGALSGYQAQSPQLGLPLNVIQEPRVIPGL